MMASPSGFQNMNENNMRVENVSEDYFRQMFDEYSDDENMPDEIMALANAAKEGCIPAQSKEQYDRAYNAFQNWKRKANTHSNNENVVLAYLNQYSQTVKPPTIWAHWAMIKAGLLSYDNVDTSNYHLVTKFIKKVNKGYKPKKSKVLSPSEVRKFIDTAPDDTYLAIKVIINLKLLT